MRSIIRASILPASTLTLAAALACGLLLSSAAPAGADLFVESDDYKDGEEIVDVFLTADEYSKMVDDFERKGQSFDWGWALTPKWEAAANQEPSEQPKKKRFFRRGGGGPKPESEPEVLAFDLSDYSTVLVPEIENFSGIMKDDELESVRQSFELAVKQMGLEPVRSGSADLELKAVVVDINREGGGFGLIQIDPFIEIELRLRDLTQGRDLLLIRNQEHGDTPDSAALEFASQLAQFLR